MARPSPPEGLDLSESPCAADLRGLDPPQPLVRILDYLEGPVGPGPHAFLLSREPHPLYGMLAAGGWSHRVSFGAWGVELVVYRKPRR